MDLFCFLSEPDFGQELVENQVRFVHLGRKDRLPKEVVEIIAELEKKTARFDRYWLNLAMDYGGLDEVARATAKIIRQAKMGLLTPEEIEKNPKILFDFLDTQGQPLPDLIIRTGVREGEIPHTSGLMPLQSAYSCWYFIPDPDLFPNLTPQQLLLSIKAFVGYERRMER
jgi:undecaprenyl diphosphate synthase